MCIPMIADGCRSEGEMIKCGDRFCSNPEIKLNCDVHECVTTIKANHPKWKGACFYQRDGKGCEKCGGKIIKAGTSAICISCGSV